ncbi:MAG TPA: hypothetical protein VFX96_08640 [Pyrinomonadaceae bacterium]|nr:hypothetical protein [Pyrinomonadaceae bacterium]
MSDNTTDENKSAEPANASATDDVTTLDGILHALYDSISGPAERKRDLRRFRSLFYADARLIPTRIDAETGAARALTLDVDEFFKMACEHFHVEGFFEREAARRVERFGHVTHVMSTYESRRAEDEPEPFQRGVNSIQLFHDGARYFVVTIFWDFERPDNPLPPEYLPS